MVKIKTKSNRSPKGPLRETLSTLFWAFVIAFVFRTFLFQPFHIPSGSMQPGLVKGDYIITSKYSLGYGQYAAAPLPFPVKSGRLLERHPKRGDVIVFRPVGQNKNFIKRLVGLPGDEMQMISGRLFINGERVPVETEGQEIRLDRFGNDDETTVLLETFKGDSASHRIYDDASNSDLDNTSVFTVPAGHYFMMGDNRDHSTDSRVSIRSGGAGYVPVENLMGKAEFVLLSASENFSLVKPWTWLSFRKDRFFKAIK